MSNYLDFAIDMETLGTHSGCVVLSIGLIAFDPQGDGVKGRDKMYWEPDIEMQLRDGLSVEARTLAWWAAKEDPKERSILQNYIRSADNYLEADGNKPSLQKALVGIQGFYKNTLENHDNIFPDRDKERPSRIWCTGADFDIAMLRWLCNKYQLDYPFDYRSATDLRTFCDALDFDRFEYEGPDHLKKHHALDDAIYLAHTVQEVYRTREVVKK